MKFNWKTMIAGAILVIITIALLENWYSVSRADAAIERQYQLLLIGEPYQSIESFTITGRGVNIQIDDHETLTYLTKAFNQPIAKGRTSGYSGLSYSAFLTIWPHEVNVRVQLSVIPQSDIAGIIVSSLITGRQWDDVRFYEIRFPQPVPLQLTTMLSKLRNP